MIGAALLNNKKKKKKRKKEERRKKKEVRRSKEGTGIGQLILGIPEEFGIVASEDHNPVAPRGIPELTASEKELTGIKRDFPAVLMEQHPLKGVQAVVRELALDRPG